MAYLDLTNTFEYKLRIATGNLLQLMENDEVLRNFIPANNRPVLRWRNFFEVDLRPNNRSDGTDADLLFPDGTQVLDFINDPLESDIFNTFLTASWTTFRTGGIRPGLSKTPNTWYAIYAVRATLGGAVMVGDDTLPLQANVATLNTRYGQNRWIYLGMIRHGDNGDVPEEILKFVQVRNETHFLNVQTQAGFPNAAGIKLVSSFSTIDLDWDYSPGVGSIDIPDHIKIAKFSFFAIHDTVNHVKDSAGTHLLIASGIPGVVASWRESCVAPTEDGVKMFGASLETRAIYLFSFYDSVLGLGYNPQI